MSLPDDCPAVDELFADANQLYVGILLNGAPHVTPELLATGDGRLWCLTASVTKKAEVLRTDSRVAFMAMRGSQDAVIGVGSAAIVDVASPSTLADGGEVVRAAAGSTRFLARNAAELGGAALDAILGRLGRPLPPRRVVVSIEPLALALLRGTEMETWGAWAVSASDIGTASAPAPTPVLDENVAPDAVRDYLEDGDAAVGWTTNAGGCLVLPGSWSKASLTVTVAEALFRAVGASAASGVAVVRDGWTGLGPSGKQGVMVRGRATAVSERGSTVLSVSPERLVYWDGVHTGSSPLTAPRNRS